MSCGLAVKRLHDYDYISVGDGVEAKRPRTANVHCSPFMPQLGTLAASLPHSNTLAMLRADKSENSSDASPFSSLAGKYTLSSSQLDTYLRAEIDSLRRRKVIARRTGASSSHSSLARASLHPPTSPIADDESSVPVGSTSYRRTPGSPSSVHSDSDNESSARLRVTHTYRTAPHFSFEQVKMICERLLSQQEVQLRQEYEILLGKKLDEQHDQYVQFVREQGIGTAGNDYSSCSYLS